MLVEEGRFAFRSRAVLQKSIMFLAAPVTVFGSITASNLIFEILEDNRLFI